MLKIENLTQQYLYGAKAVDSLSLEVNEGEHVAILGGKESGKTSLLKAIAGLYPVNDGRIFNLGKDITELGIKERDLMLVQDDGGIFHRRTVRYNLEYPLKVRKIAKSVRRLTVESVADKYGLSAFLHDYCFRLYEPEIVKLALARTSLRTAPLVMIDDIFALLPSDIRCNLFEEVLERIADIKSTLLFATTSVDEAFSVGERVVFMHYGKALQIGTPDELIYHPSSLNVDRYVNPHRNYVSIPIIKDGAENLIKFGGYCFALDGNVHNDEYAVVSYSLKPNANGERFLPTARLFKGAERYLINADGVKAVDDGTTGRFSPAIEDIRIYSLSSENPLTFLIR